MFDSTTADLALFRRVRGNREESVDPDGARVGDRIGDFRLLARIASGGQGEVWEAQQESLKRRVALKLVLPDRINDLTLALFSREARAGGRLHHPGIVAVHGHGEDDGRRWIAQELIEGAWTLRDFIDEMRGAATLPEDYHRAVAIFIAKLADALQAAHDMGVIHRDVKPQNVLIAADNHPKLTDFGLARITDETALSMTGDIAGTWLYMSPEQVTARRSGIDHSTDIFSLGVVMYEMLALQRPFDGDTVHQIAENIVMRDPPDVRKIRSRVPRDLAVICAKAMEKAKAARFQTMADLAADLRRHLASEPIHAQPPTAVDRGLKWMRRNPTRCLVGAVVATALVAISGLTLYIADQKSVLLVQNNALGTNTQDLLKKKDTLERDRDSAQVAADAAEEAAGDAHARAREAVQTAEDAWRLSLEQNYINLVAKADDLWPAWPEKIPELEGWIVEAEALVAELPELQRKQDELESLALPLTDEEAREQRESHAEFPRLALLRAELEARRGALLARTGEGELELPEVDWSRYPTDANALNSLAWPMVDPAREEYGQEALGLVLARRAVELAPVEERAELRGSVAWGAFAVGRDEEALAASYTALEEAPEHQRDDFAGYLEKLDAAVASATTEDALALQREVLDGLDYDLAALVSRVNDRREWTFPTELEASTRPGWWHHTLTELIRKLASLRSKGTGLLTEEGVSEVHGWSVPRRLASAERLRASFSPGGDLLLRWEAALPAIRSAYAELDLPVQMGLVPIGPDPASGLWEFWHVPSGTESLRGDDGTLNLEESSGVVLVLLPGDKFWMGASADPNAPHNYDPGARSDEAPVHEVELSPFFISKYEMTQAQWSRLAGSYPSFRTAETWPDFKNRLPPVEQVTWSECDLLLRRLALTLPSEARWEYACRSGSTSSRPFEEGDFSECANIRDQSFQQAYTGAQDCEEWTDGFPAHCPVGSLDPNWFGLHDMIGNVTEWCLDVPDPGFYESNAGVDPVNLSATSDSRITRGGGFYSAAWSARSAQRAMSLSRASFDDTGLRPAQGIATSPASDSGL